MRQQVVVDENAEPATVGELRSVRRWLLVTLVWAVAATAIAVIALVSTEDDEDDERAANRRTAGEVARVQEQLNERVGDLEARVARVPRAGEVPSRDDVRALAQRVRRVESASGSSSAGVEEVTGRVDELDARIAELEDRVTAAEAEPDEPPP